LASVKVLVTGASGFIGRRAIMHLAGDGRFEVIACSRSTPTDAPTGVRHESADLLDADATHAMIERVRPTHLLHLAWDVQPGRFWSAPGNLDWAAATLILLRAFLEHGGTRAIMAGTCAEYDWTGDGRLTEETPANPATLYGAIKDATRRAVCAAGDHLGGSVAWGRIFWLYGPGEAPGRLVSDVTAALAAGRPIDVSEGLAERDFLHVDDVAGAFVAALSSNWRGPFNIGSGEAVALREVVSLIGRAAGRPDLIRFGARPTPPNEPPRLVADAGVLRREIGYAPGISLDRGLAENYQAARATLVQG
jgi:nucleoside-diphosphate-sugar epimerase